MNATTWRILNVIKRQISQTGIAPSYREIAKSVGLASTCTIGRHLAALEKQGLIKRKAGSPRHIQLIRPTPDAVSLNFRYTAVVRSKNGDMRVRSGTITTKVEHAGNVDIDKTLTAAYSAVAEYLMLDGCLNELAAVTITVNELRISK